MSNVIHLTVILAMLSCSSFSGVVSFYEPYKSPEERGWTVVRLAKNEKPLVQYFENVNREIWDILAEKYIIVGRSSFNGPDQNIEEEIIYQAKNIGATLAVYSKIYTDTRLGSFYYQGTGGTYSIRRFDYIVYFLVKFVDDVGVGIEFIDLDSDQRRKYGRNLGAIVNLVYKNSPAFYSNILRGDYVLKINGLTVIDSKHAISLINSLRWNEELEIEIIRDGRIQKIQVIF